MALGSGEFRSWTALTKLRSSRAVILGYRYPWSGMYEKSRRASREWRWMFRPPMETDPVVGRRRPVMMRIVVVLPAPLGPRYPKTVP
ncbi:MAG: hypothetical protein NZ742_01685 [Acidobacteria bacterium]|nr:hypothetical protein [Acidobacteriota bacterium]